jgi:hypothetical protein
MKCCIAEEEEKEEGRLSAEMVIMSLVVRKLCGGMDFIKLGRSA